MTQPHHHGRRERIRKLWYKHARHLVIGVAGVSIIIIGLVFIIVPGPPASLTIAMGIAVLGTEFLWAKRLLRHSKDYLTDKLPDSQSHRIKWGFAKAAHVSLRIAKWLHQYIVKPLTPRRKRA
jgi:hypothetical protein